MTTGKIVIMVAAAVLAVGLMVVVVAGGIVGFALYSIGNSEAAGTARDFLRQSDHLKRDIGEIKDFGSLVTGNVNVHNGDGNAQLNLKVIGERKTVNATVEMISGSGRPWRVTAASYKNEEGQTVDLRSIYDF